MQDFSPGSFPYFALTRFMASPWRVVGKNCPSLDAVSPSPQNRAMGSLACASITIARASLIASLSTCQRDRRDSWKKSWLSVAAAWRPIPRRRKAG